MPFGGAGGTTLARALCGATSGSFQDRHCFLNGPLTPELPVQFHCRKSPASHAIKVEDPIQVIDFVLEYASVPSGRLNPSKGPCFVETLDFDTAEPANHSQVIANAEAGLKIIHIGPVIFGDDRIDQHMERNRRSLLFNESLRR